MGGTVRSTWRSNAGIPWQVAWFGTVLLKKKEHIHGQCFVAPPEMFCRLLHLEHCLGQWWQLSALCPVAYTVPWLAGRAIHGCVFNVSLAISSSETVQAPLAFHRRPCNSMRHEQEQSKGKRNPLSTAQTWEISDYRALLCPHVVKEYHSLFLYKAGSFFPQYDFQQKFW